MNVLEDSSSLDTLAFNYLSFRFLTLLNTLWTRLALSFSRIPSLKPELHLPSDKPDPAQEVFGPHADSGPAHVPTVVVHNGAAGDVDGVTKGKLKFTLYYERECESDVTLAGESEWEWEKREGRSEWWWDSWERVLRMRNGENENGWYTCQDLTALSGNVVKFWDVTMGSSLQLPSQLNNKDDASSCVRVW